MKKFQKIFLSVVLAFALLPSVVSAAITAQPDLISTSDTGANLTISNDGVNEAIVIVKWGTTFGSPSNPSTPITLPAGSGNLYTITGLTPSTTYYYIVVDAVTSNSLTSQASFTTQASGTGFTIDPTTIGAVDCASGTDGYCLLAPLPGLTVINDTELNDYFGIIYRLLIGLAGVLAVVMIFFGGVQYMTTDALGEKEEGRKRIWNAVVGLVIALGSYAILNTVNPKLLDFTFGIDKVSVQYTPDEQVFSQTEEQTPATAGYTMSGTFQAPQSSPGVDSIRQKLAAGFTINQITVNTGAHQATFSIVNGAQADSVTVPVALGKNGVAEIGQAQSGDGKTPKGTTYINSDRRISTTQARAVFDRGNKYNMGAAFINIGTSPDRGIGFHGRASNTLSVTNGCIRMYNDDLVALAPYMKTGTKVVIQ